MADKPSGQESGGEEKSLEMRVAELEDKLAQMHITEDEIKAYQKVAGLLGQGGGAGAVGPARWGPMAAQEAAPMARPCGCALAPENVQQAIAQPIYRPIWQCIRCIIYRCWAECVPWGPGNPLGGGFDPGVINPGEQFGQFGG